jgi:nicotinamidase-related amidase
VRESYLDSPSFVDEAEALERWSSDLGREVFAPGATALLVIDMQGYFLEPESHAFLPAAGGIIAAVRSLTEAFAALDLPVFFTRHLNTPENAGSLGRWWSDIIREDDPLSAISPRFDTTLGTIIEKTQYDALYETGLESLLHQRGVDRVVVTGVATHLCCETTARSAFVRGFSVTMPFDGTATYDRDHHLASLVNLAHGFATITSVRSLLAAVGVTRE